MPISRKDQDLELWRRWDRSRSTADLDALLKQTSGLMHKEIGRWSGVLAPELMELEAARLAKQAFETYNPRAGAALSTHVTNYLQKLSRLVYQSQNLARLPEYQTLKINTFQRAHNDLENTLGRPPTVSELADNLKWSQAAVTKMRKSLRKEEIESVGTSSLPAFGSAAADPTVDLIYHDLNPVQKSVFEHSTGYGGAPVLSGDEMMKKLKLSQGQLSYLKQGIVKRVKSYMDGDKK